MRWCLWKQQVQGLAHRRNPTNVLLHLYPNFKISFISKTLYMWTWILIKAHIFLFSITTHCPPGTIYPASWEDQSQSICLGSSHPGHGQGMEDLMWAAHTSSTRTFQEQSPGPALSTALAPTEQEQDLVHPVSSPTEKTAELMKLLKDSMGLYISSVYCVINLSNNKNS